MEHVMEVVRPTTIEPETAHSGRHNDSEIPAVVLGDSDLPAGVNHIGEFRENMHGRFIVDGVRSIQAKPV